MIRPLPMPEIMNFLHYSFLARALAFAHARNNQKRLLQNTNSLYKFLVFKILGHLCKNMKLLASSRFAILKD